MIRCMLGLMVVLTCAVVPATELLAQAGQTVPAVPQRPPSIDTTSFTCRINCDTQAMNCQNSCPSGLPGSG